MKISPREAVLYLSLFLLGCLVIWSCEGKAQSIMTDTMTTINTMNTAIAASEDYRPRQAAPLYQERVPGKPEEGFVPVTTKATKPKSKNYQYTKVDYPYGEVLIFEDSIRKNVCYITIHGSRIAAACVPMK